MKEFDSGKEKIIEKEREEEMARLY